VLHSIKKLEHCRILATDTEVGSVSDIYFDDARWVVRYLIVETGSWLASRKVLISPFAIGQPDWIGKVLPVSITKELVKAIPTSTRTGRSRGTKCATLGTMAAAAARQ